MDSFDRFRQELRDAMAHLHDPDYQPSELLYAVMGCRPQGGAGPVQSEILRVIGDLEPPPGIPTAAGAGRYFELLRYRFVLKLSQEETAERLHVSVRHLRREQRVATHMLARLLWEHSLAREVSGEEIERQEGWLADAGTAAEAAPLDWRSQVRKELASLQGGSPVRTADVPQTIRSAVQLESVLTSRQGVSLRVGQVQPGLAAAIHPTALRQILIMAIAQLARCASPGEVTIQAALEGGQAVITLIAPAAAATPPPNGDLIREILAAEGGSLQAGAEGGRLSLRIAVPSAGDVTVLVVDDNPDSVHYYRRCTAGTRYRIVHAAQGHEAVEAIEAAAPDIVVLDIMLPDVDGWEVLARLREKTATRAVPVIVCSIVKEEDLALALGAAVYLPKPVQYREFLQALDRALNQASRAAPKPPGSNARAS